VLHTKRLRSGFFERDDSGVSAAGNDILAAAQKREHGLFNFGLKSFVLALKIKKRNHKTKCGLQITVAD
jgi:hypothetical protein